MEILPTCFIRVECEEELWDAECYNVRRQFLLDTLPVRWESADIFEERVHFGFIINSTFSQRLYQILAHEFTTNLGVRPH